MSAEHLPVDDCCKIGHASVNLLQEILKNQKYKPILAAVKGFRNGLVYGVKVRAPHALVMTFLFSKEPFLDKISTIIRLVYTHAKNLSCMTFVYKLLTALMAKLSCGRPMKFHSFLSASLAGYFIFGKRNAVNMQISLYLLSRITISSAQMLLKYKIVPTPSFDVFPWFTAFVWGTALYLFENENETLQSSLNRSMTYLYRDSDHWTSLKNFVWHNR